MEIISFMVLILLSLVGYSVGAVGKAGKSVQLKPQIIDLILISVIWAGAIYSRVGFDFNKWLMILVWVVLGILIGVLAIWPRKLPEEKVSISKEPKEITTNLFKKLWQSWGSFSKRMGDFQSRIFLSMFFFIVVSPFALAVKMFSDPLRIRYRGNESHWLSKMTTKIDLEQSRKQF